MTAFPPPRKYELGEAGKNILMLPVRSFPELYVLSAQIRCRVSGSPEKKADVPAGNRLRADAVVASACRTMIVSGAVRAAANRLPVKSGGERDKMDMESKESSFCWPHYNCCCRKYR